jgi:hypothetical protein
MKTLLPMLLLLFGILMACQSPETRTLGIDIQSTFENDHALVFLDADTVYNDIFTTNQVLGVCPNGITTVPADEGVHRISVILNGTVQKNESFAVKKDHYIGVNFDRVTGQISFVHSNEPFGYD